MSIVFLAPAGLALLAALLVPILLHLARRRRAQPTTFAALRWLAPGAPPRSRVRIVEWLLLALRLLLLALLAAWLAQPVWRDAPAARDARVVVVPGVDVATARAIAGDGAQWLAPGWPSFEDPAPATQPVASLLRELDAEMAPDAALTVIVPAEVDGLDAGRIVLARAVDWRVVPAAPVVARAASREPVLLALRHGPDAANLVRHFTAAVAAWNTTEPGRYRLDAAPWGAPLADDTTWLVGLDGTPEDAVLRWIERGGTALLDTASPSRAQRVDPTEPLRARRRASGAGQLVLLSAPLRAGRPELLDASFPQRLQRWLAGPAPAPDRARAEAVAPVRGAIATSPPGRPLAPWLALAIALVFLAERVLATGPRRERAR